jgi:hypothetical protein
MNRAVTWYGLAAALTVVAGLVWLMADRIANALVKRVDVTKLVQSNSNELVTAAGNSALEWFSKTF